MGKLLVIDGTDSSGKETQAELLTSYLKKEKHENVMKISFPLYSEDTSIFVRKYLNGDFGNNPEDVNAYIASVFYTLDRYASLSKWKDFYDKGGIIVTDRYVTSNLIHQGVKIKDLEERKKFFNWILDFEYRLFKIPKPDKIFFLNMPIEYSIKLLKNRNDNKHGNKDIHEDNIKYLKNCYENAMFIASQYKDWTKIDCINNLTKDIKDKNIIHKEIINNL